MTLLKKTRIFWIYDLIITIFFSACYFVKDNPSGLLAWAMFIDYPIIIFEEFIAGPFFAIKIQKNNLTTKELVWSTFLIFTITFITFCIPEFALTYWKTFFEQEIFVPLSIALIVSITYYITNIICKKVRR